MTLNNKQLEAVNFIEGPCLVIAGAGSGKTRVLTERIVNLISKGVRPQNILAITFTNKAAKEMRERVKVSLDEISDSIFIGTFHSFGVKVLRENYELCGFKRNITILDRDDLKSLIKKIMKDFGISTDYIDPRHIINRISFAKNEGLSPLEYSKLFLNDDDQIISKIYKKYNEILNENNSVDFDDLLILPVKLFKEKKEVLERYQEHFKYILVDEYQDTNPIQYDLCRLMSDKYKNIFVVGDSDQSIYAFRNADYKNIINFEKDYDNTKVIVLEENYRSTKSILNVANSVIRNNSHRKEKNLWSNNSSGELVEYIRCENEKAEGQTVVKKISELMNTYGYSYKDFGVLYRTNSMSRPVEEAFLYSSMPYKVIGSYFFYARKEIKDLIAYLSLVYNKDDNIALERVINVPKRGIGGKSIEKIRDKATINNTSMFDAIDEGRELEFKKIILDLIEDEKTLSISELVESVLVKSKMIAEYEKDGTLESEIKIENLNDFKSIAVNFEEKDGFDLASFLENIALVSDSGLYKEVDDAVSIMTIHSAKGLEFQVVFILGMEEGIFPHMRSLSNDEIEEERRLCYVGVTRARKQLFLLNSKKRLQFGKTTFNPESRFINEIDSEYLKTYEESNGFNVVSKIGDMYEEKDESYQTGDLVKHIAFGEGTIISINNGIATIAFRYGIGIKQIATSHKNLHKISL